MQTEKIQIKNTFVSERKSIKLVEPIISDLKQRLNIPDEKYYNILIAVTEAVNNAIIHGNKCSCGKLVDFNINIENSLVHIEVSDQGSGFEADKVADPRHPDNLYKTGGRGVFLIRELSDNSEFFNTECGAKIVMEFKL